MGKRSKKTVGELYEYNEIPLEAIDEGDRFRKEYGDLEELSASIKDKGVVQPITVTRQEVEGKPQYLLVAGGRRFRAAQIAELKKVPVIIRSVEDELDFREIELIENIQRKDMHWTEQNALTAKIDELMREKHGVNDKGYSKGWGLRDTAKVVNRSVGGVHRQIQMHQAVSLFPELAKYQSEDKAVQALRKLKESAAIKQTIKEYKQAQAESDARPEQRTEDPKVARMRQAESHFQIGDAFDGMQYMLDNGLNPPIALIEVDPPYGIDLKGQKKGDGNKALDIYEEVDASEYPEFLNKLCAQLFAVSPPNCRVIFWFGPTWQQEVYSALFQAGFKVDPIPAIWFKGNGQTNSPDTYLARAYEPFFIAWRGAEPPPIRQRGRANVFHFPPVTPKRKYHPTQRPLPLMREILRTFAFPSQIIMVPFLGSGATLRAAYLENMTGWGWELNEPNKEKFLAAVAQDYETESGAGDAESEENSQSD